MASNRMQTVLRSVGMDTTNYRVSELLPLVYEGWLSGTKSPERELQLVDLAHQHLCVGEVGEHVLRGWLRHRPEIADLQEGLVELVLLAHAPYESAFELGEVPGLLAYSKAIARTSAAVMDEPDASRRGDDQAMAAIAHEFGVVGGASWGALVRELRTTN